jgi:hypothetical protein
VLLLDSGVAAVRQSTRPVPMRSAGEARKTTAAAISSGSAVRPIGTFSRFLANSSAKGTKGEQLGE